MEYSIDSIPLGVVASIDPCFTITFMVGPFTTDPLVINPQVIVPFIVNHSFVVIPYFTIKSIVDPLVITPCCSIASSCCSTVPLAVAN